MFAFLLLYLDLSKRVNFLLFLPVNHAMNTHPFITMCALVCSKAHYNKYTLFKERTERNISFQTAYNKLGFIQLMTKKLSGAFFGDKKLTQKNYSKLVQQGGATKNDIQQIFAPYTTKISKIQGEGADALSIFAEFIAAALEEFGQLPFQKFSSAVQIVAHVFEHSFQKWLTAQQSFRYFSQVLVRHSLFRPPHSVCVFDYEDLNRITAWWLTHFHRYYEEYSTVFSSSLNNVLLTAALPRNHQEIGLGEGKATDKGDVLKMLQ